jgi:hypothetical protein
MTRHRNTAIAIYPMIPNKISRVIRQKKSFTQLNIAYITYCIVYTKTGDRKKQR